jgi:hypothetical protein
LKTEFTPRTAELPTCQKTLAVGVAVQEDVGTDGRDEHRPHLDDEDRIRVTPGVEGDIPSVTEGSRAGSRAARMAGRAKTKYPHCPTYLPPDRARTVHCSLRLNAPSVNADEGVPPMGAGTRSRPRRKGAST